jgi:hypothetical protein
MSSREAAKKEVKSNRSRSPSGLGKAHPGSKAIARHLEDEVKAGRLFGPFHTADELFTDLAQARRRSLQ